MLDMNCVNEKGDQELLAESMAGSVAMVVVDVESDRDRGCVDRWSDVLETLRL
jgi:hypothetical protein